MHIRYDHHFCDARQSSGRRNAYRREVTRVSAAFRVLGLLRELRAYEKRHLQSLTTCQDHDLVCEIGHHQGLGKPLGMKQLLLLDVGSAATLQRRLSRMCRLGLLRCTRSARDRRVVEVTLSPRLLRFYARCGRALGFLAAAE
jgi:hypothetical protein